MHVAVIGSGLAGTACAAALVARGIEVTILDVGEKLDAERQVVVERMKATPHREWSESDIDRITENATLRDGGIPTKYVFGSSYVFAHSRDYLPTSWTDAPPATSLAHGGFSNAWGAAMLPADPGDLTGWPVSSSDMDDAYRRVLARIPLSGTSDALDRVFPLHCEPQPLAKTSSAVNAFHDDLRATITGDGTPDVLVGKARLSLYTDRGRDDQLACVKCGLCLSGCPIGAIHSAPHELAPMIRSGQTEYISGLAVTRITEQDNLVRVDCLDVETGQTVAHEFDRVFVGAGALNTTRIMLNSLGMIDVPVPMLDTQKFLVPMLRFRGEPLTWPDETTLAGLFIEAKVPSLSEHWTHMQVTGVNELVLRRLGMGLDKTSGWRWSAFGPIIRRLLFGWGSLHSADSAPMSVQLSAPGSAPIGNLHIKTELSAEAKRNVSRARRHFSRVARRAGAITLAPATAISPPGSNGHFGGSFPMTSDPVGPRQTDTLGRPQGWKRTHLIDASVFPSIPGTTIALVIMGNADRIASRVPRD